MQACGSIVAKLHGGSLDGQCYVLMPAGAVGPPQFVCFYGNRRDDEHADILVLDTYEAWKHTNCGGPTAPAGIST